MCTLVTSVLNHGQMSQVIFGNQDAGDNTLRPKLGSGINSKSITIDSQKNTHSLSDMYHQERKQTTISEYFKVLYDVLGK